MRRSCRRVSGAAACLALLALPATGRTQGAPVPPAPVLARLTLVERQVEQAAGAATWQKAVEGGTFRIGERLRTGPDALARLDLPWMALTVSPGSVVSVPDQYLLSAVLESGRAVIDAQGRESLKVVTQEAEVRGQGRAVVRRQGQTTLVTCLAGRFVAQGGERTVTLSAGQGTVVTGGGPAAPAPAPLPPASSGLRPGHDCVYVAPGEPVELRWEGRAPAYQVELLPVGTEYVLMQRDVTAPPARLEIPWPGAFRWRVSSRDARGLEGSPSTDGLVCVDAR